MKITTLSRVLLVVLSLSMALSLFACGEETNAITDGVVTDAPTENNATEENNEPTTPAEPTTPGETAAPECEHEEVEIPAVAATCTETGLTAGKKCSKCDEILVAQEVVAALGHTEEVVAGTAATCTEKGLTEGKKCSVCDAVILEQEEIAALGHAWDAGTPDGDAKCEEVAKVTYACTNEGCDVTEVRDGETVQHQWNEGEEKTPATCTTDGVKLFTCTRGDCGKTREETISALGHKTEKVEEKAPTCVADGNVAHYHCSVCGKNFDDAEAQTENADVTIAMTPDTHAWVDVAAKEPAPHEDGNEAYKDCANCDKVANTEGTVIDAIPTIPGLDCEFYFKPADIKEFSFNIADDKATVELSEDGTYVRYSRKAEFSDGHIYVLSQNTKETGRYLVYKYRTDHMSTGNVWATKNAGVSGSEAYLQAHTTDGQWHIMVIDLAARLPAHVADDGGKYTLGSVRIDVLDNKKDAGYFDLAYIIMCDDLSDVAFAVSEEDKAVCHHGVVLADENCRGVCYVCGKTYGERHDYVETYTDAENIRTYSAKCSKCDATYSYDIDISAGAPNLYLTPEDILNATYNADSVNISTESVISADGKYVTMRDSSVAGEGCFYLLRSSRDGEIPTTGKYMMIKYRTTCPDTWQFYIGANNGYNGAQGGADKDELLLEANKANVQCGALVADGEWRYVIIDMAQAIGETYFKAEEDGTSYAVDYIRWDIFNGGSVYTPSIDLGFVAFADDINKLLALDGGKFNYSFVDRASGTVGINTPISSVTGNLLMDPSFLDTKFGNYSEVKTDAEANNMPYAQYTYPNATRLEHTPVLWGDKGNPARACGQYIGMIYRADHFNNTSFDFFINSTHGNANGKGDCKGFTIAVDGDWRFVFIDLASIMDTSKTAYYVPATGITGFRFDYNGGVMGEHIDIACIAMFDSREEADALLAYYKDVYGLDAGECEHSVSEWTAYSDNDESTYIAALTGTCTKCGGEVRKKVPFVGHTDTAIGSANATAPAKTTNNVSTTNFAKPNTTAITSKGNATVVIQGWGGVAGGTKAMAYRVFHDGGVTEWIQAGSISDEADDSAVAKAVVSSTGGAVEAQYAHRLSITADLSAYIGQKVSVEFAFIAKDVPADCNDIYIPYAHFANVQVVCDHGTLKGEMTYIDDGNADTDSAVMAGKCVCGQQDLQTAPSYIMYLENVTGNQTWAVNKSTDTVKTHDATGNVTADADDVIKIGAWGGVVGGTTKLVYKVFKADGTALSSDWTVIETGDVREAPDIAGELAKKGIEANHGRRFADMAIDLTDYFAQSENLTVKLAFVADGAPEGSNDKYVYLCDITNITKAAQ